MANFMKIFTRDELPQGVMRTVTISGKRIAVANVDGEYFAVDDTCTHEQCSLGSEGFLDQNVITCGCHGAQFDVTNGNVLSLPATMNLTTYQVKREGNDILILL